MNSKLAKEIIKEVNRRFLFVHVVSDKFIMMNNNNEKRGIVQKIILDELRVVANNDTRREVSDYLESIGVKKVKITGQSYYQGIAIKDSTVIPAWR